MIGIRSTPYARHAPCCYDIPLYLEWRSPTSCIHDARGDENSFESSDTWCEGDRLCDDDQSVILAIVTIDGEVSE